jgi:competence ComEA-like helix-hairpin-helix protein
MYHRRQLRILWLVGLVSLVCLGRGAPPGDRPEEPGWSGGWRGELALGALAAQEDGARGGLVRPVQELVIPGGRHPVVVEYIDPYAVRVPINSASAVTLSVLPGIGPVLAGRIVEFRERRGPFRDAADLAEVPGLGPRTLERILPLIRFTDGRARAGPVARSCAGGGG